MSEGEARLYFFDTSALVKRYHQEVGTERVDAAFEDQGAAKMMSDIGVIEFYSVFAKKVRTGEITAGDYQGAVRELVEDIRSGVIRLTSFFEDLEIWQAASDLAFNSTGWPTHWSGGGCIAMLNNCAALAFRRLKA